MIRLNRGSLGLALAAALAASSLALPACAETNATEPAAALGEANDAAMATSVPTPPIRPSAAARKQRIASAARVRRAPPHPAPYWVLPPYQRVAVHWPILFIGIGW